MAHVTFASTSAHPPTPCQYCGGQHIYVCPRIKAVSYTDDGRIKSIEFWDNYPRYDQSSMKAGGVTWQDPRERYFADIPID